MRDEEHQLLRFIPHPSSLSPRLDVRFEHRVSQTGGRSTLNALASRTVCPGPPTMNRWGPMSWLSTVGVGPFRWRVPGKSRSACLARLGSGREELGGNRIGDAQAAFGEANGPVVDGYQTGRRELSDLRGK